MTRPPHVHRPDVELEEFFDLSLDPLSITGFDGEFKRVNASFLRLLGYSKPELFSRSALDILHPDDVESARAALAQLATAHDLVGFEARVVCADSTVRWLEWNTRSMHERGVVYSVGRDITDRRRTEAELREMQRLLAASRDELVVLAEEQAALGRVATLVAEGASPNVVLDAVAGEMERALGADGTLLLRYEPDEEVSVVAGRRSYPRELRLGTRVTHEGENVSSTVRRTGRPVRMADYQRVRGPIAELARAVEPNIHSAVGAPIVVDGELWGVISAQWAGERSPPVDTEKRMSEFAELLGTAIANTESRAEVERLAQEQAALRRVATLVADEAPQEEVLAAIAAEIGPLIGIEETRLVRFVDDRSAVTIASAGSSDEFPVGELVPADPGSGTLLDRVLATGESVSFDPYTPGDGPVAATLRRMGIRSGVCAPIYVEGRVWGSINIGSQQEALARDAESRLAEFTDLLATAISNTESRAQVERLAQEQTALRRVATLVAQGTSPEDSSRPSPRRSATCWPSETPRWGASNRTATLRRSLRGAPPRLPFRPASGGRPRARMSRGWCFRRAGPVVSTTSRVPRTRSASRRGRRASSRPLEVPSSSKAISGAS